MDYVLSSSSVGELWEAIWGCSMTPWGAAEQAQLLLWPMLLPAVLAIYESVSLAVKVANRLPAGCAGLWPLSLALAWAGHVVSGCLCFPVCKVGLVPHSGVWEGSMGQRGISQTKGSQPALQPAASAALE